MGFMGVLAARLRGLFRRDAVLDDIDEELRAHVEMATEANVERGMSPEEARREALASFGNVAPAKDRSYGNAPPVMVVSRSFVRRFLPGEEPIGMRLNTGGCSQCPWTTIVGVVGDVKHDDPGVALGARRVDILWLVVGQ